MIRTRKLRAMTPKLLTALALLPALGGCMGTQNRGLESVHQPVVARQDYAIDLQVASRGLAAGEGDRLAGWLGAVRVGYGDMVAVDDPSGLASARDDVARAVAAHGLLLAADAPVTNAPVTPGTVRVIVSRMRASVPGCPDYSRDSSTEYDSNTSSNYGCAINGNIAAMIARPSDLVRGQSVDGADVERSTKAIEAFRKAAPSSGAK